MMLESGELKPDAEATPLGRRGKCPQCGSRSVAKIEYGLPGWDPELEAQQKAGRVVLGGCCVTGDDPNRHCNVCGHDWRSRRRAGGDDGGPEIDTPAADEVPVTIHDPQGAAGPGNMPRTAKRVGTFEWASSPGNSREDTLFISGNRDRSLWILWLSMPDLWDFHFSARWVEFARATCPRSGMTAEAAARRLVTAVYRAEIEKLGLGEPLVVRGGTLLAEGAMQDLAEAIWGAVSRE